MPGTDCSPAGPPHLMSPGCEDASPEWGTLGGRLLVRPHCSSVLKCLWVHWGVRSWGPFPLRGSIGDACWHSCDSGVPSHASALILGPFSRTVLVLLTSAPSLGARDELLPMENREVSGQTCPLLPTGTRGRKNSNDHERQTFCKALGLGESSHEILGRSGAGPAWRANHSIC